MIQPGKYSATMFKKLLAIPDRAWRERREELLDHLKKFFIYEIKVEGRYTNFYVQEQFAEYEPLGSKKDMEKIKQYYEGEVDRIVKQKPYNTGANISRNIIADGRNIFNHAEGTICNHVCPIVKENYIPPICEKKWVRLSDDRLDYIPLNEEQLSYLYELIAHNSKEGMHQKEIEAFADYKSGYIDEHELKAVLMHNVGQSYGALMQMFKGKFGFYPMRVGKLQRCAWDKPENVEKGQE